MVEIKWFERLRCVLENFMQDVVYGLEKRCDINDVKIDLKNSLSTSYSYPRNLNLVIGLLVSVVHLGWFPKKGLEDFYCLNDGFM